jgi:OOP family OmpA-OmpF porin
MRTLRVFTLATLLPLTALAQSSTSLPAFDLEHLTLNPGGRASMLIGTGDELHERELRVSLGVQAEFNPLMIYADGKWAGALISNRFTGHLVAGFGITDRIELALQLPVVLIQTGDDLSAYGMGKVTGTALGTPLLQGRFGFLSQERGNPVDFDAQVGLGFPFGAAEALSRDQTVSFIPRLGLGRSFGAIRAGLRVGALIRGATVLSPQSPQVRDEIGSAFNIDATLTMTRAGLRAEVTLMTWIPFTRIGGSVELLAGVRYPIGWFEIFALGGPGFGSYPGTPAARKMIGLSFSPPLKPKCVEGEPYVLGECPELDRDSDTVKNASDACPEVAGVPRLKGCPVKDADKDGVEDEVDKCPNEPGPAARNGCPIRDRDHDGIEDEVDACPDEPGTAERKGCPVRDRDHDGIEDDADKCPDEAGPPERQGCPVKDQDGDTVPDEFDNCPTVAGPPENQGCPAGKKQLVIITRDKLVIKDKVYFDTGRATLKVKSYPLLNNIADVLKDHSDIDKVKIEGHTDSTGRADVNRKLSQARAEAVMMYLVRRGVKANRLEAKGYGPDRPADTNLTATGREANRRVEFIIENPEVTPP